jgi:hypothetical protein
VGGKKRAAALKREWVGNKILDIRRGNSIESEISGILPGLQLSSSQQSQVVSESYAEERHMLQSSHVQVKVQEQVKWASHAI